MKTYLMPVMIFAVGAISPVWGQQAPAYDDRPRISVSGEAVVNVVPDKIVINLGIETWETEIALAKQKNNDILKKAIAAIKECDVPEKDIQTDQLSVEPRYKDDYTKTNFIGYFVRNSFVVTLSDASKVEQLVTKVLEAGVNYIHSIDFQTTDFKKYREQARELALRAAKEKADKMAAVLGQTVGAPIQINETEGGWPWRWYWSSWSGWGGGYGRNQGMAQNVIQNAGGTSGEISDTIALGKIAIRAGANVTFELKK